MNVLVWQSYGSVRCFAADTIAQLQFIVTHAGVAMTGWGNDEALLDLIDMISKMKPDIARRNVASTMNYLAKGHDAFEVFEFTTVEGVR